MVCGSELRGLGEKLPELEKLGVNLLALSVDPPREAKRMVDRLNLEFPVLCDTQREIIKAYGLVHERGGLDGSDIPIPAQVLIGQDGTILSRFASVRTQDRLDPGQVLSKTRKLIN